MSTAATSPTSSPLAPPGGPPDAASVLVATSGGSGAGALRLGRRLAARAGREPTVVTVLDELPAGLVGSGLGPLPPAYEAMRRRIRRESVQRQLHDVLGPDAAPPVELLEGDAPARLAGAAREWHAGLLVVGAGRHELGSRLLFGETALRAIRLAPCPVLVVPDAHAELPTVAVAAIDFGPSSVAAARAALRVLGAPATLHLVHVWTRLEGVDAWMRERYARYADGLPARWERVVAALQAEAGVTVRTTTLETPRPERHVPEVLLAYAASIDAGLIAVGRRRRGLLERLLIGSVTTGLVRGAHCAVLAVPAPSAAEAEALAHAVNEAVEGGSPPEWAAQLDAFTRRNRGRRTTLEVDDERVGAQVLQSGYPLLGATYDRHDDRVLLTFGGDAAGATHLAHTVQHVRHVTVQAHGGGVDRLLTVDSPDGRAVLTFTEPPPEPPAGGPPA